MTWESRQNIVIIKNTSSLKIPPFAVLEVAYSFDSTKSCISIDADDKVSPIWDVRRVTSSGVSEHFRIVFNGNREIAAGGTGVAFISPLQLALISDPSSLVVPGSIVGPVNGQWYMSAAGTGWTVKSLDSASPAHSVSSTIKTMYVERTPSAPTSVLGHAKTPSGGVPPKVGNQMGSSLGTKKTSTTGGLLVDTSENIQLYNPSSGPIAGSTDVAYVLNGAGIAVIVVEDCAAATCDDPLPVISNGPVTLASGSAHSILLSGTGPILNWTLSGSVPPGMSLITGPDRLFGTPTAPGAYSVTLTASNCAGSASKTFTITVT